MRASKTRTKTCPKTLLAKSLKRQGHSDAVQDSWLGWWLPELGRAGLQPSSRTRCARSHLRIPAQCYGQDEKVWFSLLLMTRSCMELLLVRLLDQTVQVDLSWFQVNVLQPRMVENVFQRRPVRGAHGQTPLDEVLALCGEKPATTGQSEQAPVHPVPPPTVSELCPALPIHPLFGRRAGWQGMCQLLQPPTGDEAPPELPVSCRLPKPIIPPCPRAGYPPGEMRRRKKSCPRMMSSSCSKGTSPQTML